MQGGIGEDQIELIFEGDFPDIRQLEFLVLFLVFPGRIDHPPRGVDTEHESPGRQIGQTAGQRAIPAAEVEDPLIAPEPHFSDQPAAPFFLMRGGSPVFFAVEFESHWLSTPAAIQILACLAPLVNPFEKKISPASHIGRTHVCAQLPSRNADAPGNGGKVPSNKRGVPACRDGVCHSNHPED